MILNPSVILSYPKLSMLCYRFPTVVEATIKTCRVIRPIPTTVDVRPILKPLKYGQRQPQVMQKVFVNFEDKFITSVFGFDVLCNLLKY